MPINDWIVGDMPRLPLLIVDANDVAVDPTAIRLLIKPPAAAVRVITAPEKIGTGSYQHYPTLDKHGTWYYRWEVTVGNGIQGVVEGSFTVQPSRFVQP